MKIESYRTQQWLESTLSFIWDNHFDDVARTNEVRIIYGRKAKRRLGSIGLDRADPSISIIRINPIFMDLEVPEHVISATIVHELTHYAHGFNSPHTRKHQHPHRGGVIRQEFAERGLEYMYIEQNKWLKENWQGIIDRYFEPRSRPGRNTQSSIRLPWWMSGL